MYRSFLVSVCMFTVSKALIMSKASSKNTQPARGWNAADICTNSVYTIHVPRDGGPIPFLALLLTNCWGRRAKSWPDDTHKQTHPHSLQSFGLVPFVINKPQSDVNIHTTAHHQQNTTTHSQTKSQPKDTNIVILQININGIRNKIEKLKKLVHSTQPDIITIQETKQNSHINLKHQKYPNTPPYAHTGNTNKAGCGGGGAHHTHQGRHNFHKHTQGNQHTQHITTTGQNTHRQD